MCQRCPEAVIATTFEQVDHFMDEDVFQALRRFLRQFQIQPDTAGLNVAGPPLRLHPSDTTLGDFHPDVIVIL